MKAFPSEWVVYETITGKKVQAGQQGMDLRDYFAAKAMQGLLSIEPEKWYRMYSQQDGTMVENLPTIAYQFADSMMKARESNG